MDKFTVTGEDGSVDVTASAAAYAKALTDWKATNEVPTETIEMAVEAVFDRFPSQRLSMPSLLSMSVHELGATPDQHKALTARVHAYVKGQCGLDTAKNTGRVDIAIGKGGGVLRLSLPGQPVPARPAKKTA
jgi:hypothetical protein